MGKRAKNVTLTQLKREAKRVFGKSANVVELSSPRISVYELNSLREIDFFGDDKRDARRFALECLSRMTTKAVDDG